MSDFALTEHERDSGLWKRLARHMEAERDVLRERNDDMQLDERITAATRGRIAQLTDLLALGKAPEVDS
jgi:hypothetical protein